MISDNVDDDSFRGSDITSKKKGKSPPLSYVTQQPTTELRVSETEGGAGLRAGMEDPRVNEFPSSSSNSNHINNNQAATAILTARTYPKIRYEDITVRVTGSQHTKRHSHGMRHKMYRIELDYQNRIHWTIHRGAQDFVRLHSKFLVKRLKGTLNDHIPKLPHSLFWNFRRAYERAYDRAVHVARQLSAYSLAPSSSIAAARPSQDGETRQLHELEDYILALFSQIANSCEKDICIFFECSAFTLHGVDGVEKLKEGQILKRAGGRQHRLSWLCLGMFKIPKRNKPKWFVIGDDYVAYLTSPQDGQLNELLLCDAFFDVQSGKHANRFYSWSLYCEWLS